MEKIKKIANSWLFALGFGLFIGVLVILAVRFFTYKPDSVHYHANFAVYLDGKREEFKGPQYYEEFSAASCNPGEHATDPNARVHMHGNVNDVIHVHDSLVTWGNFFQNLGWGIGDDYIKTPDIIYQDTDKSELSYILNGKPVDSVANKVIQDKDKLLVSYGIYDQLSIDEQFKSVASTAEKYDNSKDTAACGSNAKPTVSDRLHHLF